MTACIEDILKKEHSDAIKCERLESKYEHLYALFYVSVCVLSTSMRNVIECVMNPDSWPAGLLVKRFYHARQDGE